ncbi:Ff.00g027310.m01.CDS01 [Fusarium sp. VM40]|nr:Ff.00g027310.m01.CDS01 [Fusarium sp. VM40]
MLSRFFVFFPLVLSMVGFILSMLCLFAGHKEGFMEDYSVARLNTSMIGHNLLDTNSSASTNDNNEDDGFFDKVTDKWNEVKDDVKGKINEITGDVADKLADTIGVSEWYSIHIMATCDGQYKPNATNPGAGYNVTNCTNSAPEKRFNLTEVLDKQLSVGPFELSLADIDWPDDIQDSIDLLNSALLATFILYVLAVGFSGLAMLACIGAFFLFSRRGVNAVNLVLSSLAALVLLVSSILVTIAGKKGVNKINDIGDNVGVSASLGNKFLALTWAAAAVMIAAAVYWFVHLCLMRRERKRQWKPRKGSY